MSKFKPWLVLSVIFIAGVLTGAALTIALGPHFDRPPGTAQLSHRLLAKLTERLKLTDAQQAQLAPVMDDTAAKIHAVHDDEITKVSAIMRDSDDKVEAVLTPDQKAEFQKIIAEREKMFASGHMHGWHHDGPDDSGGPPPPPAPDSGAPPPPPTH